MDKLKSLIDLVDEKFHITRRSFMKGTMALGATASFYGCSKGAGDAETIYVGGGGNTGISDDPYSKETNAGATYRYGTSAHNCGGRCIIKAQVVSGRIVRFLTDEQKVGHTNKPVGDGWNSAQSRACARCRAYKTRLYHPGRLKYPLKQTKQRGDMSGFVRITWKEALTDIADRLKAVQKKYGVEAFHSIYACGNIYSEFQSGGYNGVLSGVCGNGKTSGATPALKLLGGVSSFAADYSFHQYEFMGGYGVHYSGFDTGDGNMKTDISRVPNANDVANGTVKKIVLWGSNITSTVNPLANPWVQSTQAMRDKGGKVYFIGPEFSDTGVAIADEWIKIKPYTDSALILGMMYYLLTNNKLEINYIDTACYGFFDSPEHYLDKATGAISLSNTGSTTLKIDAVPAGMSLASYILGDGTLQGATLPDYGSGNFISTTYAGGKRVAKCSYPNKNAQNSLYATKRDFTTPKTPAWASKITGVPEAKIIELAELYADAKSNQVWNEWSGGQLKQAEGCNTLFMMQALNIITRNWGTVGSGITRGGIGRSQTVDANQIKKADLHPTTWATTPVAPETPVIGVTQWHNAIKFAFGDQLKANGYKPNIPDWKDVNQATGQVYFDDGGVKALVKRKYTISAGGTIPLAEKYTDKTYFAWYATDGTLVKSEADGAGKTPVYSGFRFILNSSGNIPVNQHANSIDSVSMYKALPTYGYANGTQNVDIADAFYLVTFDNFMAPAARYSDYVLPAKTTWEQADFKDLFWGNNLYIDEVISGPGESKSTWDFTRDLLNSYGGATLSNQFVPNGDSFRQHFMKTYVNTISKNANSPFKDKTWNEFLDFPYTENEPNDTELSTPAKSTKLTALETGLGTPATPFTLTIITRDATTLSFGGIGADWFTNSATCPNQTGRFHLYSGSLVWRYKNSFNQWHGYLPADKRGQSNLDREGEDIVYPIPMYFAYEDYFIDAYGLTNASALQGRYLLTTTHDRYRAHSSQAENPYLRELNTRTVGGGLYSGNDSGSYAISTNPNGNMNEFPNINSLIDAGANGSADASYSEFWINPSDASAIGAVDGSLLEVYNEIGTVRVTARLSERCVEGFVGLHQGCWFDPRMIGGKVIDVGGNCNTLMASRPSRYDHGNASQSAMVNIRVITK